MRGDGNGDVYLRGDVMLVVSMLILCVVFMVINAIIGNIDRALLWGVLYMLYYIAFKIDHPDAMLAAREKGQSDG